MIVNLIGLALIVFIVFWFWGASYSLRSSKEKETKPEITVTDSGYEPGNLVLKQGGMMPINIIRKTSKDCLNRLVIPSQSLDVELPVNKQVVVHFDTSEKGRFQFQCQMNMYKGFISVV